MKKYFKLHASVILLILIATFTVIFSSCNNIEISYDESDVFMYGNGAAEDEEDAGGDEESSENTDDDAFGESISIIEAGKTEFTIVVSNKASEAVVSSANTLKEAFKTRLGIDISIRNEEFFKLANGGKMQGPKIIVGALSSDEISRALEMRLRDGEYTLKVTDGSLYMIGGTDGALDLAVNYFVNFYMKPNTETLDFDPGIVYRKSTSASIGNMTVSGNEIWKYGIVYHESEVARLCAVEIKDVIADLTGYTLPIYGDSERVSEYEILVGKTNRDESRLVRDAYARPNVYYDIQTRGSKLVIMGEGYLALNTVTDIFGEHMATIGGFGESLDGDVKSGDILDLVDADEGKSMAVRAQGTDIRVMHWNMAAPYLWSAGENAVYTDNKMRGEIMADAILQLFPDVLTTNEFYKSHNGDSTLYNAVMGELGEYYNILESDYEIDKPSEGANAIPGKTINSNIIYRNNVGLTVITSGWRYASEKTDSTESNPDGWVYYHGYHSAVFKTYYGDKFVISVAHNASSREDSIWVEEHLDAVDDAKSAAECNEDTPIILTGDMYTFVNHSADTSGAGYRYLQNAGYSDAQISASVNANDPRGCIDSDNTKHGTFHDVGVHQITRASEDFIWTKNGVSALIFKVLTSREAEDTSDHYPVVADLKFN